MRHLSLMVLVWSLTLNLGIGQVVLGTKHQVEGYRAIPQERIFVHLNASFLLPGEYLYYKVYCMETGNRKLSQLSKIAYVELVGPQGKSVFRHKIRLENGIGYGDFFVPTGVVSGGYKLLAYTQWMRNQDQTNFYQSDVSIINPYLANQDFLQKSIFHPVDSLENSGIFQNSTTNNKRDMDFENPGPIKVAVNGQKFGKRSKVTLTLTNLGEEKTVEGNYSISVRKKDGLSHPEETNMVGFFEQTDFVDQKLNAMVGHTVYLPELRGELFSGKVTALKGTSLKGLKVAVSIPGEDYFFQVVQTDLQGNFHFNIDKGYSGEMVVLQVFSESPADYRIELLETKSVDYSRLDFKSVRLDTSMREEIRRRSVHNQIENSYFRFRPDSVLTIPSTRFSAHKEKEIYILDDYTRFKTLRETILEIVNNVSSVRLDRNNYAIRIKGYDYANVSNLAPLILVDGCLVQDLNTLLEFDARKIEEIMVLRHKFVFGPEVFQGALVLRTRTGEGYDGLNTGGEVKEVRIFKPEPKKKYFVQRYDQTDENQSRDRLPDDRLQLLWIPELKLGKGKNGLEFFTSDVTGEFEIQLEGLTMESQPISIGTSIYVE